MFCKLKKLKKHEITKTLTKMCYYIIMQVLESARTGKEVPWILKINGRILRFEKDFALLVCFGTDSKSINSNETGLRPTTYLLENFPFNQQSSKISPQNQYQSISG